MFAKEDERNKILFLSTFPPRECGIATFAKDLADSIDRQFSRGVSTEVVAINVNSTNIYNYPKNVAYQITDNDLEDYIQTAKRINQDSKVKVVSIQHEFGIFGGEYGDHLLAFLEVLTKPVVVTFHSILPRPKARRKKVVNAIADRVQEIIVMTKSGVEILKRDYGVKTPIRVIPHGIPYINFEPQAIEKRKVGLEGRTVLSSFGLISRSKGYEYVIKGLPKVVEKYPNLIYTIVGQTHPVIRKREGEEYRNYLEKLIKKLGLKSHVKFYSKYVPKKEIIQYLKATDIYISPSLTKEQITSGTLVYAMGAGRPVVSTPFTHAKDVLTRDRGRLVKFDNPASYTRAIFELLENKEMRKRMERNSYNYTRHMTWDNVAKTNMKLFREILSTPSPTLTLHNAQRL